MAPLTLLPLIEWHSWLNRFSLSQCSPGSLGSQVSPELFGALLGLSRDPPGALLGLSWGSPVTRRMKGVLNPAAVDEGYKLQFGEVSGPRQEPYRVEDTPAGQIGCDAK